ncbi:MAG: hypothetical protein JWQ89_4103 [Devosia sp.]|uniref:hypothetical protein n=1 Tax=Devosia sp. TaxID=1871048 RepID=UPI00262A3AD2|nr:hypothetical protein [Devosia sp.]MDB5542376.1 hypothetical protein [Devosia sp.]
MTPILSTVMKFGRAALVALTLGVTAITAMPVQAQSFNFEFGIQGGGNSFSYGFDNGRRFKRECLTNREIRRGLNRSGFDNVRFVDRQGVRVYVLADYGRRTYSMTVNRCTGRVSNIERVRRGGGGYGGYNGYGNDGPGFGMEFNFGNGNNY